MFPAYQYEQLDSKTSIRLAVLDGGNLTDPLRCEIITTELGAGTPYEAVSYVWGSTADPETIKINSSHGEKQLEITQNLTAALRRLRYSTAKRTLWIDSICINQEDSAGSEALQELYGSTWWRRAWIWQEYYLAKDAIFFYGEKVYPKQKLMQSYFASFALMTVTKSHRYFGNESFHGPTATFVYDTQVGLDGFSTLDKAVKWRRGTGCKFPSDLIYSVLGTVKDTSEIRVDYNLLFEQVFAMATWQIMLEMGDLDVFHDLNYEQSQSGLPSWTPDWRRRWSPGDPVRSIASRSEYATVFTRLRGKVSVDYRLLTLSGVYLDTIRAVHDASSTKVSQWVRATLRNTGQMSGHYDPTDESLQKALRRICFLDRMHFEKNGHNRRWHYYADGREMYERIWRDAGMEADQELDGDQVKVEPNSRLSELLDVRSRICKGRSIFVTEKGRLGMASKLIQPGDIIVLLSGGDPPFVLRHVEDSDQYTFVADNYLHGYIDGEGRVEARKAAHPEWDSNDPGWLSKLGLGELPFPLTEFCIR